MTMESILMQIHDTQCLYAWKIYLRVRHTTGHGINWQSFQRTNYI